ncbi:hypothetical protein CYMTET_32391, partial [Cymbomonas tetramitiformis]
VAGKKVFFAGDSLTGQHFSNLVCHLTAEVAPINEVVNWYDAELIHKRCFGSEYCLYASAYFKFKYNVTLFYNRIGLDNVAKIVETAVAQLELRRDDLVIVGSSSINFALEEALKRGEESTRSLSKLTIDVLPTLPVMITALKR